MKGLGSISNNHGNTSSKAFAQEKNMKIDQKIQKIMDRNLFPVNPMSHC